MKSDPLLYGIPSLPLFSSLPPSPLEMIRGQRLVERNLSRQDRPDPLELRGLLHRRGLQQRDAVSHARSRQTRTSGLPARLHAATNRPQRRRQIRFHAALLGGTRRTRRVFEGNSQTRQPSPARHSGRSMELMRIICRK